MNKFEAIEAEFQLQQANWRLTGKKEHWDKMWMMVQNCVSNIIKSKLKGINDPYMDSMILEATSNIMNRYLKSADFMITEKLSSYCYKPCLYPLYNEKKKFHDNVLSYESLEEDGLHIYVEYDYDEFSTEGVKTWG